MFYTTNFLLLYHLNLSLHFTTKQIVLFTACTLRNRVAGPWEADFIYFDFKYYSELSVSQCTEKEIQICFSRSGLAAQAVAGSSVFYYFPSS